jgi:AAA+ ATPase superfamily predicted ATPase
MVCHCRGGKMLFQYGKVVTGSHFYDRNEMQKKVLNFLTSGQSFMIKAPRRYGKTSLIKEVMRKNNIDCFSIDFRKTPRLEIFNDMLLEYVYSKMGIKGAIGQMKENAIAFLRQHKTTVGIKTDIFETSVEFFSNDKTSQDIRLTRALDFLENVAKELNTRFYVFFDEFQDVKKITSEFDILELMRGAIQHHEHICYIFAGSNMTMMTEVFENKKSPFYNFCRKLKLDAFDITELAKEIQAALRKKEIAFASDELLLSLLQRLKGHPANTMLVMGIIESKMMDNQKMMIDQAIIDEAYEEALEEMGDLISEYLKEVRTKEHLHDVLFRMANGEEQVLEPSSLQQKRKYLVDMGYLLHIDRGEYQIIDGFLEEDLKRFNG